MALSGHSDCGNECPLLEVKRTSKFKSVTSAFDPNRTFARALSGCLELALSRPTKAGSGDEGR